MLPLIISRYRHSIKIRTINNHLRLISNIPFNDTSSINIYRDNILIRKFNEVNDWYIKFTGLDEVKRLQDKVITIQERLERVQEERRQKGKIIVDIRKDATMLQEQLHQVKKWENVQKFVDLTQKEAELMKSEREITAQFEILDKEERELFTTLCNTIRDSHEKEKAQSEYTKYWGIILSIVGTIVGAFISTIISTIRNRQIISGINDNIEKKFGQISSMYEMNNLKNGNDATNRDLSENIFKKISENIKEVKELRNGFNYVINVLHENDKLATNKMDINHDVLKVLHKNDKLTISEMKPNRDNVTKVLHKTDETVSEMGLNNKKLLGNFNNNYQIQPQTDLQVPSLLGILGISVASLITFCLSCCS